jgi:cholesterol oxidase
LSVAEADPAERVDVIIVGSGFGGSVAALRLTEKGYRVLVVEAGRRFDESTYPKTSWRLRSYLWAPRLGLRGIQRIHFLKNTIILAGAGVGGGSLVYANVLYVPPAEFFDDPQWAGITDWRTELAPFYDQAQRMLGVADNPTMTAADLVMRDVAEEMGVAHTFRLTPVAVFFGSGAPQPGRTVDDPYFGGVGPARTGCIECGECMTGCRHNAKNTLPKNYLGLAEAAGAEVLPETTVTAIRQQAGGGFTVDAERSGAWLRKSVRTFVADQVVLAAGAYGTQRLLHRMRDVGHLPNISPRLGELSRTNSEALGGAVSTSKQVLAANDFSRGVAITSSFHPEPRTHVEPVRYGKGSNLMYRLGTPLTAPEPGRPRWLTWLRQTARHPVRSATIPMMRHASERTVIALVMQSLDNSITVKSARSRLGRWKLTSEQGRGEPNPTWIPKGDEAIRHLAKRLGGWPMGNLGELISAPMTAHFIGGAVIGESAETGVVDAYHRVYGHPGLHIVDGSTVTANLGVNPSLTITAQAERAMAYWPNRADMDPRPPLGDPYAAAETVAPHRPFVPEHAPAALRVGALQPDSSRQERHSDA